MHKDDDDEGETPVSNAPALKPVEVLYCGVCGLPPEYCEFGLNFELCKPWILKNCPDQFPELKEEAQKKEAEKKAAEPEKKEGEEKKAEKPKKKKKEKPEHTVSITRLNRGKHKFVTAVSGLEHFGVKLPEASKMFGKRFACGASVVKLPTGGEEINVQGDVGDDLAEFLQEKLNISEDVIVFEEDGKKK